MTPESAAQSVAAAREAGWYAINWNMPVPKYTPRKALRTPHPGMPPLLPKTVKLLRMVVASADGLDVRGASEAGMPGDACTIYAAMCRLKRRGLVERGGQRQHGNQRATIWHATDAGRAYVKEVGEK